MRVLAARFRDRRAASVVRERLLDAMRDAVTDVDIAPLGIPGQPDSNDIVLAGRVSDDAAAVVARLISEAGGEVVANVDESWTRPRSDTLSSRWDTGFGRGRLHA